MTKTKTLTPEQRAAIRQFAIDHGPSWKATLKAYWLTGMDASQPNGHLLRQVRNQLGPQWLKTYKED